MQDGEKVQQQQQQWRRWDLVKCFLSTECVDMLSLVRETTTMQHVPPTDAGTWQIGCISPDPRCCMVPHGPSQGHPEELFLVRQKGPTTRTEESHVAEVCKIYPTTRRRGV